MQTGPDKNLSWEKSFSGDGEEVSQPSPWIPRCPRNSCEEEARQGCSRGSGVVVLYGEFLLWTILNCLWNTPASPQTRIFKINLKSKAWKTNSSAGKVPDPSVLALLSLPRTWKNTLWCFPVIQSPDWMAGPQPVVFRASGTNPAFPRAGNMLGTCKTIMDAENSLLHAPGSFGCTCTTRREMGEIPAALRGLSIKWGFPACFKEFCSI